MRPSAKRPRKQAIDWLRPSFPQNRQTYWTREKAIAWIAMGCLRAVQAVTEASKSTEWERIGPLWSLLVDWSLARGFEKETTESTIGAVLSRASLDLDTAIGAGEIAVVHSLFRASAIKQRWPSCEGQGRGWSWKKHFDAAKIEHFVRLFLASPRDKSREELRWDESAGSEIYTNAEIEHAFDVAEERINSGERLYQCLQDEGNPFESAEFASRYAAPNDVSPPPPPVPRGLAPEEAAAARANLKSWRDPARGAIPKKCSK